MKGTHDINVVVRVESESKEEAMGKIEQMFDDYFKYFVETTPVVEYRIDPSFLTVKDCKCDDCHEVEESK